MEKPLRPRVADYDSDDSGPHLHHSGHNSAGNYYESYDDGSYCYENLDGSTYQCDADGHTVYTSADGYVTEYGCHSSEHAARIEAIRNFVFSTNSAYRAGKTC